LSAWFGGPLVPAHGDEAKCVANLLAWCVCAERTLVSVATDATGAHRIRRVILQKPEGERFLMEVFSERSAQYTLPAPSRTKP
jgi:hypothetical protein